MTRKKYDRDNYHDEYSSDSSTTSEECEEIDEEKAYSILIERWKPWKDTPIGIWVDVVDLYEYFFEKQPRIDRYSYNHLIIKGEEDMLSALEGFVKHSCYKLGLPATAPKVSQVVYHILTRRNMFCIIHRDSYHWTRDWSKKIREIERSF